MKTRVCPTKQNRAYLAPSQASSSNPPVGQSNASRSDLDINWSRNLTEFFSSGRCGGLRTCFPVGFWSEKARNSAALHIVAWILPSSSSLAISTSSNHNHCLSCSCDHDLCHGHDYTDVKFNINQPRFILLWCDEVVTDYKSMQPAWEKKKILKLKETKNRKNGEGPLIIWHSKSYRRWYLEV